MSLLFLMPYWGIKALLQLDVHLRTPQMLRLFCLALAVFDAFFTILHRNEAASRALMQGCKFTWKSAFSQMWWHYQDAFDYLVTAGI